MLEMLKAHVIWKIFAFGPSNWVNELDTILMDIRNRNLYPLDQEDMQGVESFQSLHVELQTAAAPDLYDWPLLFDRSFQPFLKRSRALDLAGKKERSKDKHISTANFNLPPILATEDLEEYINVLDAADGGALLKRMMLQLAISDPYTSEFVRKNYDNVLAREQARIIDFDHYSKSIWHTLNSNYRLMGSSNAYDISFKVQDDISEDIRSIGDDAGKKHASFGTKRSGLETLRKVGKTICLSSNNTLGHEVQKQFHLGNTCLEDAMLAIVEAMSEDEKGRMCQIHDGRSTFLEKMEELDHLGDCYHVFGRLNDVITLLAGEEQDDENEDDEVEKDEVQEDEVEEDEAEEDEAEEDEAEEDAVEEDDSEAEERFMMRYNSCGAPIR
ncbi:hypothetical protein P280DRAFT_540217 [Massarina eburnea CBS 473.64]|uniref:Uncharacterized protein n=1 Tax=Massarina eburnea CBS 473.64 TaxID=1395130 RepID=A0A6A6S6N0_9PLEO|nr:hypothetical protein P280DRAFT_540217 [Massarina eburnea CBS 473.64]